MIHLSVRFRNLQQSWNGFLEVSEYDLQNTLFNK